LQEYARIEKEYIGNSNLLTERKRGKERLTGSLISNRRELEQELTAIDQLQKALDIQLEKSSFQSLEEVTDILSDPIDTEKEKQRLARFREQLLHSSSTLQQLRIEAGNRMYDAEAHRTLLAEIATLREQITQKIQEQGKTAEQLKKLQKDLESQISLRIALEELEMRAGEHQNPANHSSRRAVLWIISPRFICSISVTPPIIASFSSPGRS